jgi:hypothetical protein
VKIGDEGLCVAKGSALPAQLSYPALKLLYSMALRDTRHMCRDPEKCTFILVDKSLPGDHVTAMVGDVNLYLTDPEDCHRAEIEVRCQQAALVKH